MVIKCPKCNHYVSDTVQTCPHCGLALKAGSESLVEPKPKNQDEEVKLSIISPVEPLVEEPTIVEPAKMESSVIGEQKSVPNVLPSDPTTPHPLAYQQAEKSNVTLYAVIAVLILLICSVGGYLYYVNVYLPEKIDYEAPCYYDIEPNIYGDEVNSNKGQDVEETVGLSGFTYDVEGFYDSMVESTWYYLNAVTPTGEKVNTEVSSGAVKLSLLAQGDYDRDGEWEAIVYEWGGGNAVEPPYLVYYDKNEEVFKKVEGFEYICEDPEIKVEEWNGHTTFVVTVGLRRDRYVYNNHSLSIAERIVPELGTRVATISLGQLFKTDDVDMNRSIDIDIDGDGATEKLIFHHDASHALGWGKSMLLVKIEADDWSLPEDEDESLGVSGNTFTFLGLRDGVVPDILCDDAWLYRWNGEKYVTP